MLINTKLAKSIRLALVCGVAVSAATTNVSFAQSASADDEAAVEKISITGSRITAAELASSSPITTIDEAAIEFLQEPEFERIMRLQPGIVPADGGNVNNGTAGAATISLRGLGAQRSLVLLDGKRMTPFNVNGQVDTAAIPSALIKRIDIVTGGASAVYGSDAIAGAVNVILKDDFEGVEIESNYQQTNESDGDRFNLNLTVGSNFADGKGNAVISFGYLDRKPVLLGDRPLGLIGIDSGSGAGFNEFLAGEPAVLPPTDCQAPGAVDFVQGSGSTTSIPTRFEILGAGSAGSFQFRNDGTLGTECSRFNFNPFNYYQTPSEKYSVTAKANYEINEHAEVFSSFNFTNTTVRQQIAPSGTFGASFNLPLYNPLIGASALNTVIDTANEQRIAGVLLDSENGGRWIDTNANGVVDTEDTLGVRLRRRTLELGPRSTSIDADLWQMNLGVRGAITDNLDYELSYQYGESNRLNVDAGYTNLTNVQNALDTRDGINCANGDSACVPIDLFGGFGTITPEMAAYAGATAFQQDSYEQEIMTAFVSGTVEEFVMPTASSPFAFSAGFEKREETSFINPDECLKLAPASCLGGAGGNVLPISGGYSVDEFFVEGLLPLVEDMDFIDSLNLEFGYRTSDYSSFGSTDSWKLGVNWRPVEELLVRVMAQKANRAPNVGELSSPVVRGLGDATIDPCSVANSNISAELAALCISTGMTAGLVGNVPDIISGQVNTFSGSDPNTPPNPEEADTFTAGFVYSPRVDFAESLTISVDYYDIEITDVIGSFSPQEVLDGCYVLGDAAECAKIKRQGGDLTGDLAGIDTFTTNLDYLQAEGIEIGYNAVFSLGEMGDISVQGNINKYLTQESQSSAATPVLDCSGFYGTSCDPISDFRLNQRVTWNYQDLSVSLFLRHIGSVELLPSEQPSVFEPFRSIDAYNYIDVFASYAVTDYLTVSAGIDNLTDEEPPVVGGEVGDTSSNGGNTFPSNYDVLGTMYKVGVRFRF
ncbi:TonB-dependent receptor [Glaciecola sp. XM2]|jgi:outer membrane receptor protein involved in Fe transport|uniref:TonB-dependent receptor plug domain-containing protein n=1 Tax=Glaciecola sp. XM2 TaxID=1914931 RepID=UPI001BDE6E88|nr:TonB-dependent receptor [Glaciecola sp. XM2]MBT1450480.1 TonB-dependent receptor [Glaciecola sp. XM2]